MLTLRHVDVESPLTHLNKHSFSLLVSPHTFQYFAATAQ